MRILVVDDQRSARKVVKDYLVAALPDLEIEEASSVDTALHAAEEREPDLVLLDIRLSADANDRGGLIILQKLRERGLDVPVVMVTGITEFGQIREAMRLGAQDYVLKDELSPEMLLPIVGGFRERWRLQQEVRRLRERAAGGGGLSALLGSSPKMTAVRRLVERVADSEAPVLLRGQTGTGKELVARALHAASSRSEQPFVVINCATLPGPLLESLLFGHEKGAFTGADRRSTGQLEVVADGTVVLDEIAELSTDLQAKLLRVIEARTLRPLGADKEVPLRARVVAATHVDLEQRMADGTFRPDLYYRLSVVTIELPSLADRIEDLPELVGGIIGTLSRKLRFTDGALRWLARRTWPGNVRELRNVIERLALLADPDEITEEVLESVIGAPRVDGRSELDRIAGLVLALPEETGPKLQAVERAVLDRAMEIAAGNKSAASRLLGVDRKVVERGLARGRGGDDT